MELSQAKAFSGVFWVNQVLHRFKDGQFTQELTMNLMANQTEQTGEEPSDKIEDPVEDTRGGITGQDEM
jgi:hypothetical protein